MSITGLANSKGLIQTGFSLLKYSVLPSRNGPAHCSTTLTKGLPLFSCFQFECVEENILFIFFSETVVIFRGIHFCGLKRMNRKVHMQSGRQCLRRRKKKNIFLRLTLWVCLRSNGPQGAEGPSVMKNVAGSVNTIPFGQPVVNPHHQQRPILVTRNFSIGTNPRGLLLIIHFKPCFELLLSCYCPLWHIINGCAWQTS